jgi:hypothetical protein
MSVLASILTLIAFAAGSIITVLSYYEYEETGEVNLMASIGFGTLTVSVVVTDLVKASIGNTGTAKITQSAMMTFGFICIILSTDIVTRIRS